MPALLLGPGHLELYRPAALVHSLTLRQSLGLLSLGLLESLRQGLLESRACKKFARFRSAEGRPVRFPQATNPLSLALVVLPVALALASVPRLMWVAPVLSLVLVPLVLFAAPVRAFGAWPPDLKYPHGNASF